VALHERDTLQQLHAQLERIVQETERARASRHHEAEGIAAGRDGADVSDTEAAIAQGAARLDELLRQLDTEVQALMHHTAHELRHEAEELRRRAAMARSSLYRTY
jgi:hypothetical protein